MEDLRKLKTALRTKYRVIREAIPEEKRKMLGEKISRRVCSMICFRQAGLLLLFAPHAGEVDLKNAAEEARRLGKKTAYPRVTGPGKMIFCLCAPEALVPGKFGIPEPPEDAEPVTPEMLDENTLMLLPAILYDAEGYRIGYGGGYYDRFLASFPGITVGIAASGFVLPSLPRGRYDRPVGILVTEKEVKTLHVP